jgi:undecaprenyl-diphosphatase
MSDPTPALTIWEAFVYGIIQGVTEFLPVSSSGHLALAHQFGLGSLSKDLELPFDVLLHASTLIAIAVAFRREILASLRWRPKFYTCVFISILPAGMAGALGKKYVEAVGDSWWLLGICYVFTAVLLTVSERVSARRAQPTADDRPPHEMLDEVTPKQALWVGLLQVLALLPGVSRSGSTIAGGLLGGLRPSLAVSYAFLVGLPLIGAAAAKDAIDGGFGRLAAEVGLLPLSVAFVAALVSGLGSIAALKLVVGKRRLVWFGGYCGLVALVCFWKALGG